jgi:hypothetical protein
MISEIIEVLHTIVENENYRSSGTFVMREMSDPQIPRAPNLTNGEKFFSPEQI